MKMKINKKKKIVKGRGKDTPGVVDEGIKTRGGDDNRAYI